jgi:hypothetical protein
MIKGFMYMERIDSESCWFHGFVNINPNFAYVPDWLVNFMVKRVVYVMIGKIKDKQFYENEQVIKAMED